MTLTPLLNAPFIIQIHALAAIAALVIGIGQMTLRKGTVRHYIVGYAWSAFMIMVAVSSLLIYTIRLVGPFSPIHILSFLVLWTVPKAIIEARKGNIAYHKRGMTRIFWLALIGAGFFTFMPGRIMHQVLFGY
jgi:uncharacterized membrane protein